MLHSKNFGLLAVLSMILLVIYLPSVSTTPLEFSIRDTDSGDESREIGPGKRGAVATENALCSRHGIEMFKMGGNAADAVSSPYSPTTGESLPAIQRSNAKQIDS
jgi:gamma-glutamyltranspeptidase/glutathione hydrolase